MNQLVPSEATSTKEIGFAVGAGGTSIAPQNLGEVIRFAEVMCRADIALPQHLRGNAGACMAVALQALEWQMSPFAVASKSYSVGGRIAYEAQLIAAVVNTRSGIKGRLRYEYLGEGNELSCRVTGILDGQECEYETPPIGAITVKNSPLWKSDPRQQLGYFAARSWARRHCPEVILGVYDRDELEHQGPTNAKDITPSVMTRLQERQGDAPAREGFDHGHVTRETSALSGEAGNEQETLSDAPTSEGSDESLTPPEAVAAEPVPAAADQEAGEPEADHGGAAPASDLITKNLMVECLDKFMALAVDQSVPDPKQRRSNVEFAKNAWKDALPQRLDFVKACFETADKVVKGELQPAPARKYLEGLL